MVCNSYDKHRCLKNRVWRPPEQTNFSGQVDKIGTVTSHQPVRVRSCYSNNNSFSPTITQSESFGQMRQYHSSTVCEQTRGGGGKSIDLCYKTWTLWKMLIKHNIIVKAAIYSNSRAKEHLSGPVVTQQNSPHRVDTERSDSSENICKVGGNCYRSVCVGGQSQNTGVLLRDTASEWPSSRFTDNIMEQNVGLCISTNLSHSKSAETHESIPMSIDSSCPNVAKKALVHRTSTKISSKSNKKFQF